MNKIEKFDAAKLAKLVSGIYEPVDFSFDASSELMTTKHQDIFQQVFNEGFETAMGFLSECIIKEEE